jgi:ABC-type multidrug transport system fused ATPase/permease subunit
MTSLIKQFNGRWLSPLLVGLGVAFLVNIRCARCRGSPCCASSWAGAGTVGAVCWHVLSLPVAFFSQRYTGDWLTGSKPTTGWRRCSGEISATPGRAPSRRRSSARPAISYDAILAAIVIGGAALNVLVLRLLHRLWRMGAAAAKRRRASYSRRRSSDCSRRRRSRRRGENDFSEVGGLSRPRHQFRAEARHLPADHRPRAARPAQPSTSAAVLGTARRRSLRATLTIGTLVAFQSLLMSFSGPVQQIVGMAGWQQVSADFGAAGRRPALPARLAILASRHRASRGTGGWPSVDADVSFGYNPLEPPLIENFSLDVAPGRWVRWSA